MGIKEKLTTYKDIISHGIVRHFITNTSDCQVGSQQFELAIRRELNTQIILVLKNNLG